MIALSAMDRYRLRIKQVQGRILTLASVGGPETAERAALRAIADQSSQERQMTNRLCFLSHFVICLAVGAAAFFAWRAGVFGVVWENDASRMTSVIAAVFVGTAVWLGWQAWRADSTASTVEDFTGEAKTYLVSLGADASFGHLAERALPMLGLFGTVFGLSLQAKALSGGAAAFGPLATSLYTTGAGVLCALIVAVMTYSLERGIMRAAR